MTGTVKKRAKWIAGADRARSGNIFRMWRGGDVRAMGTRNSSRIPSPHPRQRGEIFYQRRSPNHSPSLYLGGEIAGKIIAAPASP